MTALALLDGTARALTGAVLLAVVGVALYILVAGLRDAVDTARDVIDHSPVPPPLPVLVAGEHAEDESCVCCPCPAAPDAMVCADCLGDPTHAYLDHRRTA